MRASGGADCRLSSGQQASDTVKHPRFNSNLSVMLKQNSCRSAVSLLVGLFTHKVKLKSSLTLQNHFMHFGRKQKVAAELCLRVTSLSPQGHN